MPTSTSSTTGGCAPATSPICSRARWSWFATHQGHVLIVGDARLPPRHRSGAADVDGVPRAGNVIAYRVARRRAMKGSWSWLEFQVDRIYPRCPGAPWRPRPAMSGRPARPRTSWSRGTRQPPEDAAPASSSARSGASALPSRRARQRRSDLKHHARSWVPTGRRRASQAQEPCFGLRLRGSWCITRPSGRGR